MLLGIQNAIVPFVPASNLFFTVGVTVGERLLYPSTVGAAIGIASLGTTLDVSASGKHKTSSVYRRWGPCVLGYALLAVYLSRCGTRVHQWRSSAALFAADAAAWPRSLKAQHQLATVYHAQGRYAEALKHYNASLSILDDNALTDHCIAQIYIETGEYQKALERFEKIMSGHGVGLSAHNLYSLYIDYGFTLVTLKRFDEALPLLDQGLKRNLAVPHGLNALGFAHVHSQGLQEAQDAFAKGLDYDPENGQIWNNLAVVWMLAGAYQQAAQGMEKALLLEPDNPSFIYNAMLLRDAATLGTALAGTPRLELFFSRSA